jgi:hypothetical protein
MLIELDLQEAKNLKLTINQFLLIKLLVDKFDIKSLLDVIPISENDINTLITKNILTKESLGKDISEIELTESILEEIKPVDYFMEFYNMYPISVRRTDSTKDYLRADMSRCRRYYDKIVGRSKSKHEYMLNCLRFELEHRRRNNSMGFMKRMSKWFMSEEWLIYEDHLKELETPKETVNLYGTEIE